MDLFSSSEDSVQFELFQQKTREVFTPYAPITTPEFFIGRLAQIEQLVNQLRSPGRHAALFGDRGVGKTSLASVIPFFLKLNVDQVYYIRCTSDTRAEDLLKDILIKTGKEFKGVARATSTEKKKGLGINNVAAASRVTNAQLKEESLADLRQTFNNHIQGDLKINDGIIVIDDFDKVSRPGVHKRLAEILKHMSDEHCKTKILVVGVSESVNALFRGESSLPRSLASVHLDRFSNDELVAIISKGEGELGVKFDTKSSNTVLGLSDGFASHLHLLCQNGVYEMANDMWDGSGGRWSSSQGMVVTSDHLFRGIGNAIEGAETVLRVSYELATVTTWRKTQLFQYLIWGIAMAPDSEVHIDDIVQNMNKLMDNKISKSKISYHLGKLQKNEKGKVLTKVRSGVYRFRDPLMRGFVRLQLQKYNIDDREGQLSFAFMRKDREKPNMAWAPTIRKSPDSGPGVM
jgi:AAA domain-containing protein